MEKDKDGSAQEASPALRAQEAPELEYMALECDTSARLTKLVNEKIASGWEPIGGASVAITENFNYGMKFCQAVIRRKSAIWP